MEQKKDLKLIAAELNNLMERHHVLTKELNRCMNEIRKRISDFSDDLPIRNTRRGAKGNDFMTDKEVIALIGNLIEENNFHTNDSKIDIKTLAEMLNLTQKRIKKALSSHPKYDNLSKLLCYYRIKTACQLIAEHPNYSINAIVSECGFSSRTSFYRWFVAEKGCTPMEFLAQQAEAT